MRGPRSRSTGPGSLAVAAIALACAGPPVMQNTSPEPAPDTAVSRPIDAALVVRPGRPEELAHNDVSQALQNRGLFREVLTDGSGSCELVVTSESEADGHFGAELGLAIVRGLALGLADGAVTDEYDYRVTVSGALRCDGKAVGDYQGTGSFHAAMAESSPMSAKTDQVRTAVEKSWAHALAALGARIAKDRTKIEAALGR